MVGSRINIQLFLRPNPEREKNKRTGTGPATLVKKALGKLWDESRKLWECGGK